MSTIPTPRTDAELARLLLDQDLTNIDRREAMAEFARLLEVELTRLGESIAGVCRTNSDNATAMIAQIQEISEQRDRIAAQARHNRDLQAVLAWLNSHPDAIQRNTGDHTDGNNWALVLNEVLIGWFPSIEAAVAKGREIEALLPGAPPPITPPETAAEFDGIDLPCSEAELARWNEAAEKAGYISLRAWVIDSLTKAALPHA